MPTKPPSIDLTTAELLPGIREALPADAWRELLRMHTRSFVRSTDYLLQVYDHIDACNDEPGLQVFAAEEAARLREVDMLPSYMEGEFIQYFISQLARVLNAVEVAEAKLHVARRTNPEQKWYH